MIALLATAQGSLLLAPVVKANTQHLVSYITSLWFNSFVVDADVPHFCPSWGPRALILLFIICALYEELWQCCVFTDLHLVTCSCTVTCWQSLQCLWYVVAFVFWSTERRWKSEEPFFFNDRFCISCLKLSRCNLVNRSHKRVCFWLQFLHFAYTGSCPGQKHWNMLLSHTFVPNNLTLSLW